MTETEIQTFITALAHAFPQTTGQIITAVASLGFAIFAAFNAGKKKGTNNKQK